MTDAGEPTVYRATIRDRIRWRGHDLTRTLTKWADGVMRPLGYVRMERKSNLISHARREFRAAGWDDLGSDKMQKLMCDQVCELLGVFSTHGHSGSSAPYANSLFTKLAAFEPIVPLSGDESEWNEVGDGYWQNNRCGHVFKMADRFDGQPYDSEAVIWRDPDGGCFTNRESAKPITFPYTPTRTYVDRPA